MVYSYNGFLYQQLKWANQTTQSSNLFVYEYQKVMLIEKKQVAKRYIFFIPSKFKKHIIISATDLLWSKYPSKICKEWYSGLNMVATLRKE